MAYTQWHVTDRNRMVLGYNQKPFAKEMLSIVQKYGFTRRCCAGGFFFLRR